MSTRSKVVIGMHIGHDASVSVIRDGSLVFAEEEERHTRKSDFFGVPERALDAALAETGTGISEVSAVGVGWNVAALSGARQRVAEVATQCGNEPYARRKVQRVKAIVEAVTGLGGRFKNAVVIEVGHHRAHALSVIPFVETEISAATPAMVIDAAGEWDSGTLLRGLADTDAVVAKWPLEASLGYYYQRWAEVLGFYGHRGCGYLMSLAALGDGTETKRALIASSLSGSIGHTPLIGRLLFKPFAGVGTQAHRCFEDALLSKVGVGTQPIPFDLAAEVAAGVQAFVEELILDAARFLYDATRWPAVILSGGVMQNCRAVGRLMSEGPFERIHTGPAAKDSGVCVGAAMAAWESIFGECFRVRSCRGAFLGTTIGPVGIRRLVEALGISPRSFTKGSGSMLAKDTAKGLIVAVADGPLEFGPRALGGRSLIGSPAIPGIAARMNALKRRHHFQPVAAIMGEEEAKRLFGLKVPEPYMTSTYFTERLPRHSLEIFHVDGSCRLQTANEHVPELLREALAILRQDGDAAVFLNTSFNSKGYALPRTAYDALEEYCRLPVDVLYLGQMRIILSEHEKKRLLRSVTSLKGTGAT